LYHSLGTAPKALAKPFREAADVREDTTHPIAPSARLRKNSQRGLRSVKSAGVTDL
jgi:hypothetical protein